MWRHISVACTALRRMRVAPSFPPARVRVSECTDVLHGVNNGGGLDGSRENSGGDSDSEGERRVGCSRHTPRSLAAHVDSTRLHPLSSATAADADSDDERPGRMNGK